MKKALITGINGMDGSYMAELLLEKGYEVHGTIRINSDKKYIQNIEDKLIYHVGDLSSKSFIYNTILKSSPDCIYHLASISSNDVIWIDPFYTHQIVGEVTLTIFEAVKNINKNIKILNCSSSEIYGDSIGKVDENSIKNPKSPYGISKLFSYNYSKLYREKHHLFISNAICFNHESERRTNNFFSKKLSTELVKIVNGVSKTIKLNNIYAKKDWGYAPDFVEGMYKLISHEEPVDCIFASGKLTSIEDIISHAFKYVGIANWNDYIECINNFDDFRNNNANFGDVEKTQSLLNWKNNLDILQVIEKMIDHEMRVF